MIDIIYSHFMESGRKICTDSRNIIPGSVFFALKGENFNGNKFALDALTKGARIAIIDDQNIKAPGTIVVDDALKTLQRLANYYRNKHRFKVIALTGTNGKTTTKELIFQVLKSTYRCSATQGNLNNHIGVPLTLLSASPDTEILVVEMGANHQGEIGELCTIAEPDFGLITNIGKAHLEGFGGYEGVIKAKSELYSYLKLNEKVIFFNSTDSLLEKLLDNYGLIESYAGKNSSCYAEQIHFTDQLKVDLRIGERKYNLRTNLFGKYNVLNILAAIKVGSYFNIEPEIIIESVEKYTPDNNRSQVKKTMSNTLIMDCYNANPSSMESALTSFEEIVAENKIVILGEMKELGESSSMEHKLLLGLVEKMDLNKRYFVGNEFLSNVSNTNNTFRNTDDLIKELLKNKISNSLIFIKGSRANKLEQIEKFL